MKNVELEKKLDELENSFIEKTKTLDKIKEVKDLMTSYNVDNIDCLIEKYEHDVLEAFHEYYHMTDELCESQDVCEHIWVLDGHDGHKDYYKCTLCGEIKREDFI